MTRSAFLKKTVARSFSIAAVTAALAVASPALADPKRITVTGEATVARAPDLATLSIGVTTVGQSAGAALSENSVAMEAVTKRLKDQGIASKDLQTSGLSVNPNWRQSPSQDGRSEVDGFTAMNQLSVQIRDLATLGTILDQVVQDGANTLNGVGFDLTDPRPALDEARREAVKDARAKAELLAEAAGVKLGDLVMISEGGNYSAGPVRMMRADAAAAAVPVEHGEVSYQASVTIAWEIKDAD